MISLSDEQKNMSRTELMKNLGVSYYKATSLLAHNGIFKTDISRLNPVDIADFYRKNGKSKTIQHFEILQDEYTAICKFFGLKLRYKPTSISKEEIDADVERLIRLIGRKLTLSSYGKLGNHSINTVKNFYPNSFEFSKEFNLEKSDMATVFLNYLSSIIGCPITAREVKFENLKSPNGVYYRFDAYFKDLNLLVEIDDISHFEPITKYGGEKGLSKRKENDSIKSDWAKKNNYGLIRFAYNESWNTDYIRRKVQACLDSFKCDLCIKPIINKYVGITKRNNKWYARIKYKGKELLICVTNSEFLSAVIREKFLLENQIPFTLNNITEEDLKLAGINGWQNITAPSLEDLMKHRKVGYYGVSKKGTGYSAFIRNKGFKKEFTGFSSYEEAALYREYYLIKNEIPDKLNNLDITNYVPQRAKSYESTSKFYGVNFDSETKKYVVRQYFKGKVLYLGSFENEISAVIAREKWLDEHPDCRGRRNYFDNAL